MYGYKEIIAHQIVCVRILTILGQYYPHSTSSKILGMCERSKTSVMIGNSKVWLDVKAKDQKVLYCMTEKDKSLNFKFLITFQPSTMRKGGAETMYCN